jgi:hypothetical protein
MKATEIIKEKLAFKRDTDYKGYNVSAWYLKEPNGGNALIEIFKNGEIIREFAFPAYKVWNIAAHFEDIVEGELQQNISGYEAAAWNGISDSIIIIPKANG